MGDQRDFRIENSELRGDDEFTEFGSTDLPYYSDWHGSFEKLPWATDDEALRAAAPDVAIVGAPLDDAVSSRPGARFGPRAIRMAPTTWGTDYAWSIQLDVEPYKKLKVVDAGDAPIVPARLERGLRVIHEKVFRVASSGAIPIVLGGDHSITYPSAAAVSRFRHPRKVGIVHFDAHADTGDRPVGQPLRPRDAHAPSDRGGLDRRLRTSSRWVCAATGPRRRPGTGCGSRACAGTPWSRSRSGGAEAVIADAIAQALDGPDCIYLSVDIDVVDPGMAPGTGTPEPGGMLARELLRAVRQIVGQVELVGMDVVEVSPPYDSAEVTALLAHRVVLEAISALAAKR